MSDLIAQQHKHRVSKYFQFIDRRRFIKYSDFQFAIARKIILRVDSRAKHFLGNKRKY